MGTGQNRVNAVSRFKNLDDGINQDLNALLSLVARICDTPGAFITLLDEDTQWYKASIGFNVGTPRDLAFCNHTIEQNGVLVVDDTLKDARFSNHPMVVGAPHVRFYAGAPLVTKDGHAIGSLCVLDYKTRPFDALHQDTLKVLSKQAMNLMELNWSLDTLQHKHSETEKQKQTIEQSDMKLKAMFNSSNDTHIFVDKNLNVLAFNKSAAEFVKATVGKKIILGESLVKYTDPKVLDGTLNLFRQAMNGKNIKYQWEMRPGTKEARWKELKFVPVKDKDKKIIGVALNSSDVTERKLQEDQIAIQNAALTRIAIIQSHELRRPVASLLGILSILKMEQLHRGIDYFDMIELSINELDEKIRDIVKDSETTIHHGENLLSIVA